MFSALRLEYIFCNNHPALITQMICYQIAPFSAPTTTAINWGSKLLHLPLRHAELILDCIQFRKERIASVLFGAHVYIPSIIPSYKLYQTWVGYTATQILYAAVWIMIGRKQPCQTERPCVGGWLLRRGSFSFFYMQAAASGYCDL